MERFNNYDEAKQFGAKLLGSGYRELFKYDHELVKVNDEDVIICGTDQAYEPLFWDFVDKLSKTFHLDMDVDDISYVREFLINEFENRAKVKFVDVCDEY